MTVVDRGQNPPAGPLCRALDAAGRQAGRLEARLFSTNKCKASHACALSVQNEAGDLVFLRKRRLADAPVPIADISPGGDLIAGGTSEGGCARRSARSASSGVPPSERLPVVHSAAERRARIHRTHPRLPGRPGHPPCCWVQATLL